MKIARHSCVAFTWTSDGQCRGVWLERRGGGVRITSFWSGESAGKSSSTAEALSSGRRALGAAEDVYCIAGSANGGWGMSDVVMPSLKREELRSALSFELRTRTPIPVDRLTWGYRVLPSGVGVESGKLLVRLFYVRTDIWRKWCESASGLGHLDMIAVPAVVLDPLLSDSTAVIPGKESFGYVPTALGRDVVSAKTVDTSGELLPVSSLLPLEGLELGALSELSAGEQQSYVPALLLAAYGMSKDVERDIETMPEVPHGLRPHRYQFCKVLAFLLVVFIVCCLGFGILKAVQQRVSRLRVIRKDIYEVQSEIGVLRSRSIENSKAAAKDLEAEMGKYNFEAPGLVDVLLALTETVNPPGWISGSFDWSTSLGENAVPVTFTMREPIGDTSNLDLATRLNSSPVLGDVSENKNSQNRAGYMERRFVLKARYDTEQEKVELKEAQEKERLRKQQEEREKAEQAAAQAEENDNEDNAEQEDAEQEDVPQEGVPSGGGPRTGAAPSLPGGGGRDIGVRGVLRHGAEDGE